MPLIYSLILVLSKKQQWTSNNFSFLETRLDLRALGTEGCSCHRLVLPSLWEEVRGVEERLREGARMLQGRGDRTNVQCPDTRCQVRKNQAGFGQRVGL